MRILTALFVAGLLFAAAGCHEKKDSTTPGSTMGDAGAPEAAHPVYPPAQ
ncbi:MAG: hypothetical protein ACXVCV_06525 [Polyangia bacterium]|jgi:hypothetical protein